MMRSTLAPKSAEFFQLLLDAGRNTTDAALLAARRFAEFNSLVDHDDVVGHARIKELETAGDDFTRRIIELLNTETVTPFDREDIYALAGALDDIVDHIEHASELLDLYRIDAVMQQSIDQCQLLVRITGALTDGLTVLETPHKATAHVAQVKDFEDEGDRIARTAIASLFEHEHTNPRTIIQWKDIFEALEDAIDACEHAANVIGNIIVKHG